ncbi:MAG: hypothetical protein H6671_18400, partial [Anaerolineaceae bacterium]|nr:hypothetical protein [Anaerolineaceae bacterium]
LEEIMVDADLDVLGREDYVTSNRALRKEMEVVNGISHTDREWYIFQQEFLSKHAYFTNAAHSLRDEGKARNLALVYTWLAGLPDA